VVTSAAAARGNAAKAAKASRSFVMALSLTDNPMLPLLDRRFKGE
jgi:hypothetical protein